MIDADFFMTSQHRLKSHPISGSLVSKIDHDNLNLGHKNKEKNTWKPQYKALGSSRWRSDCSWLVVPLVRYSTLLLFSSLEPHVLITAPGKFPTARSN